MNYNILIQLRQELVLTLLIFLLLFIKLGKERSNESILNFINIALLINLGVGFCNNENGTLFNDMFNTNKLIVFEKDLLNLAALIISMQSYAWLKDNKNVICPEVRSNSKHTFHLYVIRVDKREELIAFLKEKGIETAIHYPEILPLLPAYGYLGLNKSDFGVSANYSSQILSLPMFPELSSAQITYVVDSINQFFDSVA
jgi:hypothetical protein